MMERKVKSVCVEETGRISSVFLFLTLGSHNFELHTFDHPSHCDVCHKLLHGCYFQGYFCACELFKLYHFDLKQSFIVCLACKRAAHQDCLKDVERCSMVPRK